jgi:hypothetical protein
MKAVAFAVEASGGEMKIPTRDELETLTREEVCELRARIARYLEETQSDSERDAALRALDDIASVLARPRRSRRPLATPSP